MAVSLEVSGLTVRHPGAPRDAVHGVDLRVPEGGVTAILGPSGCGKTTVLRVVAGLLAPTAGRVHLGGVDVTDLPAHRRGVGLMFQDYALFPHHDVGANVEFGLRMQRRSAAERRARVAEVLALVDLGGWERRSVAALSGGERQRVALARTLAPEPGAVLLDEPLGALDRTLRDRLVPELGELLRAVGTTVVHVTHDQGEALALADEVVVMAGGTVVQHDTPRAVWSAPRTPAVARLLGLANVLDRPTAHRLGLLPPGVAGMAGAAGESAGGSAGDAGVAGVVVRAESVSLRRRSEPSSTAAGDPAVTALGAGRVQAVVFEGARTMVRVDLDAGATIDAALLTVGAATSGPTPLTTLAPSSLAPWSFARGDEVLVDVDTGGVVVLFDR